MRLGPQRAVVPPADISTSSIVCATPQVVFAVDTNCLQAATQIADLLANEVGINASQFVALKVDYFLSIIQYAIDKVHPSQGILAKIMAIDAVRFSASVQSLISPICKANINQLSQPLYQASVNGFNGNIVLSGGSDLEIRSLKDPCKINQKGNWMGHDQ